jgi:hypothetical protein
LKRKNSRHFYDEILVFSLPLLAHRAQLDRAGCSPDGGWGFKIPFYLSIIITHAHTHTVHTSVHISICQQSDLSAFWHPLRNDKRRHQEEEEEEEEEEEFITSGNWRGKHNSLSRGAGADQP